MSLFVADIGGKPGGAQHEIPGISTPRRGPRMDDAMKKRSMAGAGFGIEPGKFTLP